MSVHKVLFAAIVDGCQSRSPHCHQRTRGSTGNQIRHFTVLQDGSREGTLSLWLVAAKQIAGIHLVRHIA